MKTEMQTSIEADLTSRPTKDLQAALPDYVLLDRAAKAINRCLHKNTRDSHGNWGTDTYCTDCGKSTYGEYWNPLADNDDAFQLAVALKLKIVIGITIVMVERIGFPDVGQTYDHEGGEIVRAAATRRAIVRAAVWLINRRNRIDRPLPN